MTEAQLREHLEKHAFPKKDGYKFQIYKDVQTDDISIIVSMELKMRMNFNADLSARDIKCTGKFIRKNALLAFKTLIEQELKKIK